MLAHDGYTPLIGLISGGEGGRNLEGPCDIDLISSTPRVRENTEAISDQHGDTCAVTHSLRRLLATRDGVIGGIRRVARYVLQVQLRA